jgi:hypothetical protein
VPYSDHSDSVSLLVTALYPCYTLSTATYITRRRTSRDSNVYQCVNCMKAPLSVTSLAICDQGEVTELVHAFNMLLTLDPVLATSSTAAAQQQVLSARSAVVMCCYWALCMCSPLFVIALPTTLYGAEAGYTLTDVLKHSADDKQDVSICLLCVLYWVQYHTTSLHWFTMTISVVYRRICL